MTRWTGRTLRARLTLSLVAVLLVACTATGVATALFLRGFLLSRLDAQLASAGGRYSTSLEHPGDPIPVGGDGDADNVVPGQSVGTLGVRLAGGIVTDAAVVGSDGRNRILTLNADDQRTLRGVHVDGNGHSVHLTDLGDYRVQAVAGRDGDTQVTGLPRHEVNEILGHLGLVEAALFTLVLVFSGLVTALIVRRTLLPLRRVADTALHVSELPLTDAATPIPGGIAPSDPTTEVDQVSVAFDHMLDHLRTALAARDLTEARLRRFVADASHELRTPLATIQAYAQYATRSERELPESTRAALGRIDAAATRMATLVDDLLLLARLDAGRPLICAPLDLTQLLVEAVDDARTAAPDHRWRLDLPDEPVDLVGDVQRLHQVVVNLLGNAQAHTPAGTIVTAALSITSAGVRVDIVDDGPGIPVEQQEELFDRFSRVDPARSHEQNGAHQETGVQHASTGLGLAIARGIAHAHGGTLTVESRPGYTCFTLLLPLAVPVTIPSHPVAART